MNFAGFALVAVIIARSDGGKNLEEERRLFLKVTDKLIPVEAFQFGQRDLAKQGRRGNLAELRTLVVKLIQDLKDDSVSEVHGTHDSFRHRWYVSPSYSSANPRLFTT